MNSPKVNLVVIQPAGYVHSLVFLDTARYFRYQFRILGYDVCISKNRIRADCINIVFGAHLGIPSEWDERYCIVLVNLEQLGHGGANLPDHYFNLLKQLPVIDYRRGNCIHFRDPSECDRVPLIEFHHAPYLMHDQSHDLRSRPIDILFIGSMNEKRLELIERIRATGTDVSVFDRPMYGPERDEYVRQSKAVINIPFYSTGAFEQVRAFSVLSVGTPLISLRSGPVLPHYEDSVLWVDDGDLESYFLSRFGHDAWFTDAVNALKAWSTSDGSSNFSAVARLCADTWSSARVGSTPSTWRPYKINLGSGKDYLPGWLNVDVLDRAEPDVVLDLSAQIDLPIRMLSRDGISVELEKASVDLIYANNVLEHVGDLTTLMTNALSLLKDGGEFHIEVPYERALTAWQDPTHIRAMNENSWIYYTDWFWYLGWFTHRFEVNQFTWLNAKVAPCQQAEAAFMRVHLRKIETTPHERVRARTLRADFGVIPDDLLFAGHSGG